MGGVGSVFWGDCLTHTKTQAILKSAASFDYCVLESVSLLHMNVKMKCFNTTSMGRLFGFLKWTICWTATK